jgi:hypothetical protein
VDERGDALACSFDRGHRAHVVIDG